MPTSAPKHARAAATRESILTTAERLFAENGVLSVSNRQISEAAGQGNNAAVGYHFGTKIDLVKAIIDRHTVAIDAGRTELVRLHQGSRDIRAWVSCMVLPVTDHLASMGNPTSYARFGAQIATDPEIRASLVNEATKSQSLRFAVNQLAACTPGLSEGTRAARNSMARILVTHGCAEFERYLTRPDADPAASWDECGHQLVDAIVGIWKADSTAAD
ncbi:helix-turn-helix transcriptional regulator [Rhodococcus sp. BP-149]|uniref:TetR/AcrR family transcriptional regulator n=1 Tax=unclassified Rhodococcus (in: high G+C Gram-positive bacteria) TaxID=192944 RepID=UPI001C9A41FB|nr:MULTISPECIES: TetR/AcrR family transcriptional regulator [unclassified Rhodococcus (in: high G+C Gram-positive bacteria)]MBY6687823.1 helix-turn-helix transcriptional regulator [Rhodococcus sp. BP-288]MBY6696088.1 helix-turn-helix transcriptional regulator [Rhodococcus sp. BP-188]MBY6700685.1 helix-turn-helix transcriptional regulator [Rhodococcus sp. BP-285]MBY6705082.1 helix-turn-helix transcriptional regulator [Rhodococcus sp. BP-283]MBY6713810.1 helix-turn-helix transcriptional regulato